MSSWYERLKEIRDKHNLSQTELAKIIGVQLSQISRYESGNGSKNFTTNLKLKLALAFDEQEIMYIQFGDKPPKYNKSIGNMGPGAIANQGHDQNINSNNQEALSDDEKMILKFFRMANEKAKADILVYVIQKGSTDIQ